MNTYNSPPPPYTSSETNVSTASTYTHQPATLYTVPIINQSNPSVPVTITTTTTTTTPQPNYPNHPTVILQQTTCTGRPPIALGRDSVFITCPYCNANVLTTVQHKPNSTTHIWAIIICILCWPCVCLPYCMKSCQSVSHYCPNCNAYIGTQDNLN